MYRGDIKKVTERELWDVCRRYIAERTQQNSNKRAVEEHKL